MNTNLSTSSNPITLMDISAKLDPATANTSVHVSGVTSNSDSDTEYPSHHASFDSTNTRDASHFRSIDMSLDKEGSHNTLLSASARSNPNTSTKSHELSSNLLDHRHSHSHSKLSDLATKVTDYLFSTRRSIDLNSSHDQSTFLNSRHHDSSNSSPMVSRENSHLSLTSLVRSSRQPTSSKRRSFLSRPVGSPTRDSSLFHTLGQTLKQNASSTSLSSTERPRQSSSSSHCHFACDTDMNSQTSSRVKETHYVHVEYDPITRKRVLNTYEILRDLGSGQHGKVKLAKDIATGALVAIKIVDRSGKPALMLNRLSRGKGQTQEDKIRKEIAIMKKCNHPHVVKLIEVLDAENSRKIYMVLEYLEKGEVKWQITPEEIMLKLHPSTESLSNRNIAEDGLSNTEFVCNLDNRDEDKDISGNVMLKDLTSEPLLSLDETKRIFRDVLSGLDYLHHQGIIHRDIKPSNLLVGKDNEVKISDFGVSFAANLDNQEQADLELAKTAGTPAFLAPELCSADNKNLKVTYKIDIWALGVTLYCLLFGKLPFYAESEYKLFENINHDDVQFPDTTRWRVAKPLSAYDFGVAKDLVLKLLDKNPETRIEIDEIVLHPFMRDNGQRWNDEYASWSKEMKIDVSNEEVDDAVVGLGNRIKKRLTDAFRKRKTVDGMDDDSHATLSIKSVPMGLKDNCSYILSEEDNKSAIQMPISLLNGKIDEKIENITKSLRKDKFPSVPAVDDSVDNSKCVTPVEDDPILSTKCAYSTSDDISKPLGSSNPSLQSTSQPQFVNQGDNYDYRNDLISNSDNAQLSINPSFASLDSFYDESYANFMAPTSNIYSGYNGSYSSRNPSLMTRGPGARSTSNSVRGSPVLSAVQTSGDNHSAGSVHSSEVRDSLKFARRISQSPSSGDSVLSGGALKNGKNVTRGVSRMKTSPIQTANSGHLPPQRSPSNMRAPGRTSVPAAVNPMINTAVKNNQKRPIFTISQSPSSDEDEDGDNMADAPFDFSKKTHSMNLWNPKPKITTDLEQNYVRKSKSDSQNAKPAPRRAVFINGDDDDTDDDDEEDDERKYPLKQPNYTYTKHVDTTISGETTPSPDRAFPNPTKSALYGTKLNLTGGLYQSDSDNDDDESDELFLSFGKKKEGSIRTHDISKRGNRHLLPKITTDPGYVSVTNICDDTSPTIVDVPTNIFESQNDSIGMNKVDDTQQAKYTVIKANNIADEIAALKLGDTEDLCGKD
jgi:SNF1-activating kinase 1